MGDLRSKIEQIIIDAESEYSEAKSLAVWGSPSRGGKTLSKGLKENAFQIAILGKEKYIAQKVEEYIKVHYVEKKTLPTAEAFESFLEEQWNHLFSPEEDYLGRWALAQQLAEWIRDND